MGGIAGFAGLRRIKMGVGSALLAGVLASCGGGTHSATHISTRTTTTMAQTTTMAPTTTVVAAPPSAQAIAAVIASTHEVSYPDEGFAGGSPVTVSDGHGGDLTAVAAGRTPSADGHGWLVFFWDDQRFLGWDTDQETWNVSVKAGGPNSIEASYPDYASSDPACCPSLPPVIITYRWSGTGLAQSRQLPKGSVVGVAVERH
jgi:LppP/LprE lipoprotein